MCKGLSQSGDTATRQLRPIAEEYSAEMDLEDPGIGDGNQCRAPYSRVDGSHPRADVNSSHDDPVEEEPEEGEVVNWRRAPKGPTKQEREEHEATHIPYRSRCKHCVRGRATNRPHRRAPVEYDEEGIRQRVPRISMDYFFMGQEGDRASEYPMLVMIDERTDNRYIRAVGRKGLGEGREMEWLVKDMDDELKSWGYAGGPHDELILKSDGERSIVAVRDALAKFHGGKVTTEQPPPGESQANGRVEEAGKTIRSYIRVLKDMVEHKTGKKLNTDAPVLQWMVRWAAMLHSRFRLGTDGMTAYQRQRGRKCRMEVIPFGETVYYRKLDENEGKNKLETKWDEGVWLGHTRGSNEFLIGTKDGVVRAWATKRRPEEERWSSDNIHAIQGTPARPNPKMPGNDIPVHILLPEPATEGPPDPEPARAEDGPRRAYLKKKDFERYGYTENCEGCRRQRVGGMGARAHTQECRSRVEAKLKEDDNPRWKRAQEAADGILWEEIKRRDPEAAKSDDVDPQDTGGARGSGEVAEGGVESHGKAGNGSEAISSKPEGCGERKRGCPEGVRGQEETQQPQSRRRTSDSTAETVVKEPGDTEMISALLRVDVAETGLPLGLVNRPRSTG